MGHATGRPLTAAGLGSGLADMVRTDGHQAPVQPVSLAQTIEERSWSPQTQRCNQGAVQPVVGPPQVLPGPAGRGVEKIGDIHDQAPAPVEHQIAAMHVVAMQSTADGMGKPGVDVLNRLHRDGDPPAQALP